MQKLTIILKKKSGRSLGKITVRHQGGRKKRYLRRVDFKRFKRDVWGIVEEIQYDPNRNSLLALVLYTDGERQYILAPEGLVEGMKVVASQSAPLEVGNALPLGKIPIGMAVHNIEIRPGKGGQVVRGAGTSATIKGKEGDHIIVKLPSGEIKRFEPNSFATLGQVGNAEIGSQVIRTAGRKRRMGVRPSVRGVAQHPGSHPHGGGEGRSGVGLKYPKTVYGKPAVGKTRKKKKYSDKLIIKPRKPGKHSN